jgi:hypothetical protein
MSIKSKNFYTLLLKYSNIRESKILPHILKLRTLSFCPTYPSKTLKPCYRFSGQEPISIMNFDKKTISKLV